MDGDATWHKGAEGCGPLDESHGCDGYTATRWVMGWRVCGADSVSRGLVLNEVEKNLRQNAPVLARLCRFFRV